MAEQTYDPCVERKFISRDEMLERIWQAMKDQRTPEFVAAAEANYRLLMEMWAKSG